MLSGGVRTMGTIEKSIMRTEVYFSEDKQNRYILRKEWDKNKKKAMVIMVNPSSADKIISDFTTMYVINNLFKLDFGSVDITNIFSKVNAKISAKESLEDLTDQENDNHLIKAGANADYIILAWGKVGENNKRIQKRQAKVLQLLEEFKEKIYLIEDGFGREGYHPLAPQIRFSWKLKKLPI